MERCVCGCVYDPRCQIKNNAGKKKKSKKFFLQGVIIFCTGPLAFPRQLAEIPRARRR